MVLPDKKNHGGHFGMQLLFFDGCVQFAIRINIQKTSNSDAPVRQERGHRCF